MILSMEASNLIADFSSRYKLDEDASFDLGHNITLYVLRFVSKDELCEELQSILSINQKVAREECNTIERNLFLEAGLTGDEEETIPEQSQIKKKDDSLNHVNILSEIENPTPSIKVNIIENLNQGDSEIETTITPLKTHSKDTAAEFGGFTPIDNTIHPASPIAAKLSAKLEDATSSVPKEIYHVKKPDPSHEPIE